MPSCCAPSTSMSARSPTNSDVRRPDARAAQAPASKMSARACASRPRRTRRWSRTARRRPRARGCRARSACSRSSRRRRADSAGAAGRSSGRVVGGKRGGLPSSSRRGRRSGSAKPLRAARRVEAQAPKEMREPLRGRHLAVIDRAQALRLLPALAQRVVQRLEPHVRCLRASSTSCRRPADERSCPAVDCDLGSRSRSKRTSVSKRSKSTARYGRSQRLPRGVALVQPVPVRDRALAMLPAEVHDLRPSRRWRKSTRPEARDPSGRRRARAISSSRPSASRRPSRSSASLSARQPAPVEDAAAGAWRSALRSACSRSRAPPPASACAAITPVHDLGRASGSAPRPRPG